MGRLQEGAKGPISSTQNQGRGGSGAIKKKNGVEDLKKKPAQVGREVKLSVQRDTPLKKRAGAKSFKMNLPPLLKRTRGHDPVSEKKTTRHNKELES